MLRKKRKNKKNKKNQTKKIKGGYMENKKNITKTTTKTINEPWWKRTTYRTFTPSYSKPEMGVDERHLNIVLFKNKDLKEIVEKCLPEADGSEFQFHYIAAQIKGYKGGKEFIVTIPLLYFNFNQEVSSAHVDFDLAEIKELVEKYRPAAEKLFNAQWNIFKPIYDFISKISDEVKIIVDEIGSVHRHPGDFSFSATDLKYDPNKPGVVYRTLEAHDYAQVDSVIYIYHNHQDFKLVTTQTRLFNTTAVDPNDESKGATGSIDEVPTIEIIVGKESTESFEIHKSLTTLINQFLGKETSESKNKNYTIKGFRCRIDEVPNFIEQLFIPKIENLKTLKIIDPKLIKAQRWGYGYGYGYGYSDKNDSYWDKYYYGIDEKDETGVIDDNIIINLEDTNSNEYLLANDEKDDTDEFEVDTEDYIEKYRYNPRTYQYELIEKIQKKS